MTSATATWRLITLVFIGFYVLQSLKVRERRYLGFRTFVTAHYKTAVSAFRDWF